MHKSNIEALSGKFMNMWKKRVANSDEPTTPAVGAYRMAMLTESQFTLHYHTLLTGSRRNSPNS